MFRWEHTKAALQANLRITHLRTPKSIAFMVSKEASDICFRKLIIRYEKLDATHLALLHLAAAIIALRKIGIIYG